MLTAVPIIISFGIAVAPFYGGIAFAYAFQLFRKNINYVLALCLGFSLYFFQDVLADSSYLGVNKGLSGGVYQLTLVLAFSLAFLFLARSAPQPRATLAFLASVALAEAFHSSGEAVEVSSTLATFPSFTFLAFSAVSGVSFVIHKFLEGFVLGMIAVSAGVTRFSKSALAGLVVVLSNVFGTLVGVYSPVNTAPLFAAGAAGWAFITVLVAFHLKEDRPALLLSLSLLGFLIVYGAGTLHSVAAGG